MDQTILFATLTLLTLFVIFLAYNTIFKKSLFSYACQLISGVLCWVGLAYLTINAVITYHDYVMFVFGMFILIWSALMAWALCDN